jgi:hypothetical protein
MYLPPPKVATDWTIIHTSKFQAMSDTQTTCSYCSAIESDDSDNNTWLNFHMFGILKYFQVSHKVKENIMEKIKNSENQMIMKVLHTRVYRMPAK